MSRDYPHLHDSVRALLEERDESRIRRIRADRWVGYARADAALSAFEVLLSFPKRTRMPNLLLCGPTNNGKSMVLEKFRRAHPPLGADLSSEGIASIPVLKIQMPPGPDERRFFGAILDALALPHIASESVSRRQDATLQLMQSTGVRLLIIDEVHNLLAGTPIALPRWSYSEEFRELLRTLEALLPLRRASNLGTPALAQRVLAAAEGILGEVVAILTRAAVHAVATGTEAITVEVIAECGFLSPSERRRVAL